MTGISRRRFAMAGVAAGALWLPHATTAQTPSPTDLTGQWASAIRELTDHGSAVIGAFANGDADAFRQALSPEVRSHMGANGAQEAIDAVTTNVVRFRHHDRSFSGHFTPRLIRGLVFDGAPGGFQITPKAPQTEPYPTGTWDGVASVGVSSRVISITFRGDASSLSATMDLAGEKQSGIKLTDVAFLPRLPLGDVRLQRVLPLGMATSNHTYAELREWGGLSLVLSIAFRDDWVVNAFGIHMLTLAPGAVPAGRTTLRLPVRGEWVTLWAGSEMFRNPYLMSGPSRYAIDVVRWDNGATYRGEGTANEDYLAFGADVIAPCDGRVVQVLALGEDLPPSAGRIPGDDAVSRNPLGNHIVIESAEGEFAVMANLKRGSVSVRKGQSITAGVVIGACGNSSDSREPHVHMRLMTAVDLANGLGIPMSFENFRENGRQREKGSPAQGAIVESLEGPAS